MYKHLFLFIIFIFLGGCGKPPAPLIQINAKITLPEWYTNPKLDNSLYMYSTGSGIDKNEAVADALNNFASKLGTTIESTFQSSVSTNSINGLINKNTKNDIKAYVSQIRISDYEVLSVINISFNETLVEIQIDKAKLIQTLSRQLTQQIDRYKQELESIKLKNILARYLELELIAKNSKKIIPDIMILKQLDSSFEYMQVLSFINDIEHKYNYIKNEIIFFIKPDKNSKQFASVVKNFISKNSLNLVNKQTNNSVNVHVNTKTRVSKISDTVQIAVYTIDLTTYIDSKQVGGNSYILKERFSGSHSSSLKNAVIHFNEEVNTKEFTNLLNL